MMKTSLLVLFLMIFSPIIAQTDDPEELVMKGSMGSVTLNGKVYHQIALQPEIPIGKLGIGLDVYFYFDSDGNVYENSWDFSSGGAAMRTLLDKIFYIRWGQPTDPFYFRVGALPSATLGHGIFVNDYSNLMEYPTIRRIGLDLKFQFAGIGFEYIQSDFKHKPGLLGIRGTYPIFDKLSVGAAFVIDIDQNAGLIDSDDDDYPDYYDHFPDDDSRWDEARENEAFWRDSVYNTVGNYSDEFDTWFLGLPLNHNRYDPEEQDSDPVSGISMDITYDFTENIDFYSEFGKLIGETQVMAGNSKDLGFGFVPFGIRGLYGPLSFKAEFRYTSENFVFNFWDRAYDLNRVVIDEADDGSIEVQTKESQLYRYGKSQGFYSHLKFDVLEILNIGIGYQDMRGDMFNDEENNYVNDTNKSFLLSADINTSLIPKLQKATAFYQQGNVPNPFNFEQTASTIYGYDIGIEIAGGIMLVYQNRTTFITLPDGELDSVNSMQIETQILFN